MTALTNIFKSNKFTETMKKIDKMNAKMKDLDSTVKRRVNTAKFINDTIHGRQVTNNKENNVESQNLFLNTVEKVKKAKKTTENVLGYIEDTQKYISPTLKKSTKISNFVNNKFSGNAGKFVENMVNFAGKTVKKDLKKYANAAKHVVETGTKNLFLGEAGPKQMQKLSSNPMAEAIYNKAGKFKDITKNIDKYSLDDITKKGSELMGKGMKKVTNPKITGLMKKAGNLKISGVTKKIAGTKVGQAFMKSFSLGNAMNFHSIMTEKSDFKKLLAGTDIAGSFVSKLPGPVSKAIGLGASTLNFAGGLTYDFLNSKFMERFGGKKAAKAMDKGAGFIVKPVSKAIKATQNAWRFMKKGVSGIKKHGIFNSLKSGMNLVKQKTPVPIKQALKTYTNMYKKPIQTAKKVGTLLGDKIKNMFKSSRSKNVKDVYNRNSALAKQKQPKIQHNGEVVQTKLQGSQIDNSTKNNFTINISGINKSTQEIMDEIVPQIKLRMKNVSIA